MPEPIANSPNQLPDEPELRRQEREPKGVLQKNLKPLLYLGAALLVIVAAIFSGTGRKTPAQKGGKFASAAPADAPGQHRQQRAGSQEPGRRSAAEGGATGGEFVALARPLARNWDARAASRSQSLRPNGSASPLRSRPAVRTTGRIYAAAAFPGSPGGTAARRQRP